MPETVIQEADSYRVRSPIRYEYKCSLPHSPLPEVGGTSPSKQQIQHIVDYFQHIYIHQEDRT
jgi:hypothetical protein